MTPKLEHQLRQAQRNLEQAPIKPEAAERRRLVAQARAEGASLREIAAVLGLSHNAVAKILRG
jgi:DNA-binding NarL/FixJ family response regulator